MMIAARIAAAVLVTLACPAAAAAQPPGPGPVRPRPAARPPALPKGFLLGGVGVQATRNDFAPTLNFTLYAEPADFETRYDVPAALVFDLGGGVRVWRSLALGLTVSRYASDSDALIRAGLPHPFYFGRRRGAEGPAPGLTRAETAVHLQASWLVPLERDVTLAVFAGPTFFDIRQDVVTAIQIREIYPYDQAVLGTPVVVERRESTVGFNAGADVFYRLGRRFGVGGVARYAFGSFDTDGDADERFGANAGGLQVTGGLRILF